MIFILSTSLNMSLRCSKELSGDGCFQYPQHILVFVVRFDSLYPSQQFFSHVWTSWVIELIWSPAQGHSTEAKLELANSFTLYQLSLALHTYDLVEK